MKFQFVEGGDAVTGTNFACIHRVVPKVLVVHPTVFIAQKPVSADNFRIEVHLNLGILGYGLKGPGQVLYEDSLSFGYVIHIVIAAVTVVGQLFHQNVVVVTHAETHRGESHASVHLSPNFTQYRVR